MRVQKLPKNFKLARIQGFPFGHLPRSGEKEIFVKRFAKHLNNEYVASSSVAN